MRTAAQERQLNEARKNLSRPSVRAKLSASMLRRHRENPELMRRGIAAMHSPEARKKAADALRRPLADRFFDKVSPEPNSGCWLWTGSIDTKGYGGMRVDGKGALATHVSLLLAGRPRPWPTACARHKCDNPPCVNPDHLEWGTLKDNARDAIERGRANFSGLASGHAAMRAKADAREIKPCDHCGTEYRATWAQIRRNRNFFCSSACSIAWQKANYTGRPISSWSAR